MNSFEIKSIGKVSSSLKSLEAAPRQADEGAPEAWLVFEPALHVNYQETVLRIKDGKPKMKDMPKEMGGSGVVLPE